MTGQPGEPRWVTEAEFDAIDDAAWGPVGGAGGADAELDQLAEATFGPLPGRAPGGANAGRRPSVEEAEQMLMESAFTGHGYTNLQLFQAREVLQDAAHREEPTSTQAAESGGGGGTAAVSEVLQRVTTSPGGHTEGFSEAQDRRLDQAYLNLWSLAESRLGMPRQDAVEHARRVFLECQQAAADAENPAEAFIARLDHRVKGYMAMSPLVQK